MKRTFITLIFAVIISLVSFGQLSGPKNIPGDYNHVYDAIAALNVAGVGSGGVTFNIAPGHTETLPSLTSGLITATGTFENPIVFRRNGAGANPVITGFTTGASSTDYVIGLRGVDYITFDSINIAEPTGVIEWGFAVLKASEADGSQFVTIKHCNISLNKTNTNTVGIYSANVTPETPTAPVTVTTPGGANSSNRFYGNNITGCYNGIIVNGFNDPAAPYAFYDKFNEIGKDGMNTITSCGGSTVTSYGIFTSYQDRLIIANNLVNGTVNGNGNCYGIQMGSAISANVDIYSNTVSLAYADANTGTFYGIVNNMTTTFDRNTFNCYGNTITNCTFPKATTGQAVYMLYNITASTINVYDNFITNNTYGSTNTGATATANNYFLVQQGTPTTIPTIRIYGNRITGNTRLQSTPGSGTTNYMYLLGGKAGSSTSVYNNIIDNNSSFTNGQTAGIYFLNGNTYKYLYGNTITGITSTNGYIYGIYMGEGYNQYIYNNRIQNLKTTGTTTSALVYGMNLSGSSNRGPMYVYNNYIGELKAPASASGNALIGINGLGSGLDKLGIYNNTVYLDGTSTGTGFGTIGLHLGSAPVLVDVLNNIIVNISTPTGTANAIALRSVAYNPLIPGVANFSQNVNNNLYYAGSPASNHLISYLSDGGSTILTDMTLDGYKSRVWPRECYSVTELPPFVNTGVSPYNLHIDTEHATQCESGGRVISAPVSIVTDYDNDPRYPNTGYPEHKDYPAVGPDLGADEFGGISGDISAPVILCTPLLNTSSLNARVLTATITDLHSVPTAGTGLPRLAWKINPSGAWSYVTGVWMGNSQYTFTFGAGVATGDVVYYFIVAQDAYIPPVVGSYPYIGAGGYSASPPSCSTPPSTPLSYNIIGNICGTFNVGTGQTYPTLTAAINDINSKEITCPVTLQLTDATYDASTETYPITLNFNPGSSSTNTMTIKPAPGVTPLLVGTSVGSNTGVIQLRGAQYVIFDGSNNGGTDRNMTVQSTSSAGLTCEFLFDHDGIRPAGHIVIKNCNIIGVANQVLATSNLMAKTDLAGGYNNITIDNNYITGSKFSISITGTSVAYGSDLRITNNKIGAPSDAEGITKQGIQLRYFDNILIENNEIQGVPSGVNSPQGAVGIFDYGNISNLKIIGNRIHDWYNTATASLQYAYGIYYGSVSNTLTEISNNVIYNIKHPGANSSMSGTNPSGILIYSGGNFRIYNNTIYMSGAVLSSAINTVSTCIRFGNSITNVDMRNNLLKNSMQPLSPNSFLQKTYALTAGAGTVFTTLDNNDYFVDGVNPQFINYANTDYPTLASWRTLTGMEANSINTNPVFVTETDLHPTAAAMNNKGTYLAAVPRDIAGLLRTNPPDIGAYEFGPDPLVVTGTANPVGSVTATLKGVVSANDQTVTTYFDYGLTSAYGISLGADPGTVIGSLPADISLDLTSLLRDTTYHFRARGVTSTGVTIYGEDNTFTTETGIPAIITVTGTLPGEFDTCYSASSTITVGGTLPFVVPPTSSVTFIAWERIYLMPGTTVQPDGYMLATIAPGTYCNTAPPTLPSVAAGKEDPGINSIGDTDFTIFPNPTTGNFTLDRKGDKVTGTVIVEVYSMHGNRVASETLTREKRHEFDLSGMPAGIYFVKTVDGGNTETMKLIKQ